MERIVDVRKIFDSVSEIWVLVDQHGTVLLASKALERFQAKLLPAVSEGVSIFGCIPQSWQSLAENVLSTLLHSNTPSILEASYPDADVKETHYEIKCTAIRVSGLSVSQIFIE